jgi:hypothetical protein
MEGAEGKKGAGSLTLGQFIQTLLHLDYAKPGTSRGGGREFSGGNEGGRRPGLDYRRLMIPGAFFTG